MQLGDDVPVMICPRLHRPDAAELYSRVRMTILAISPDLTIF